MVLLLEIDNTLKCQKSMGPVVDGIRRNEIPLLAFLLSEGYRVFYAMNWRFGMEPDLNNYTCIMDLLSRSGKLNEAFDKFFEFYADIPEEKEVKYAAHKLYGYVSTWWERLQSNRLRQYKQPIRTWPRMRRLISDRFLQSNRGQELYQESRRKLKSKQMFQDNFDVQYSHVTADTNYSRNMPMSLTQLSFGSQKKNQVPSSSSQSFHNYYDGYEVAEEEGDRVEFSDKDEVGDEEEIGSAEDCLSVPTVEQQFDLDKGATKEISETKRRHHRETGMPSGRGFWPCCEILRSRPCCFHMHHCFGGNPYSPKIYVHSASLSLDDTVSSFWISTIGEITFNVTISFFSPLFDNNMDISNFYGKKLLSTTVTNSFPHDEVVREKMGKAIFPRSSANVKTWVSDKIAKDFNSSAPVEFLFPLNAKGNLQLPGEDERRGSELGSRRTSWISIKARYDDPPKRDWGDEAYYRQNEAVEALIQDLPKFRLKEVPPDCSKCPISVEEFRVLS
ncbi:hypothetical protein RHGRI_006362 [Rhododendron griersonianum]|uniref:Uncharacterized protein n=1 Tax=Rhododendron griersonianum TaxID=479676 RepID=A0AAV6KU69_9ERIC|nr:hypothetical protein RHGRI_006362 [Rhododendron griersonianum]